MSKTKTKSKSMENIEKSKVTINGVVFGEVTMNISDYSILNIYSNNCWICGIDLRDIETFNSTSKLVIKKVNKLISELE